MNKENDLSTQRSAAEKGGGGGGGGGGGETEKITIHMEFRYAYKIIESLVTKEKQHIEIKTQNDIRTNRRKKKDNQKTRVEYIDPTK